MRSTILLGFALVLSALPLRAQSTVEAARLVAAGDTAGALKMLEDVLHKNRKDAEAHYLMGRLYMARHVPGASLSAPRRKAEDHFRYATRFEPDSAKYWVALADLFRGENIVTTRIQVSGLIRRAAEAARKARDDSAAAEVAYRLARQSFERYEHYGKRYAPAEAGRSVAVPGVFAEWKYWRDYLEHGVRRISSSSEDLQYAEANLAGALAIRPGNVRATGLLVVVLGEMERWRDAAGYARRLVRNAPDSGRAWAVLGLTMARLERWSEASAAFDSAFARMTPEQLVPYQNLGQIMRHADQVRWEQAGRDQQAMLDSTYWDAAQPLTLTDNNEVQAEFYARVTYVNHRWTDPWRGVRGWESDPGAVFVRYGPPDVWMVFNRSLIVWVYPPSRFRFVFNVQPGFTRIYYTGNSREGLRVAAEEAPARFDNVPVYRTLDTMLVQTVQFRGAPDTTDVLVVGEVPLARMLAENPLRQPVLLSGALVTDTAGHEIQRDRRSERVTPDTSRQVQDRSWRLSVPSGTYLLRAEAYVPAIERGARSIESLHVRSYAGTDLAVSDLLLADRLEPRDSTAARWTDFFIEPNGGRFRPGDAVALLWETYNLTRDSTGSAHYAVDLRFTIESIERRTFLARIIGGVADATGLSAVGDDQVTISYERSAFVAAAGVQPEYLSVDLRDAPEGRYTVGVTVTDLLTGATTTTERTLLVNRTPPSRARAPSSFQ